MTLEAVNYFWGLFKDPDLATAANASKRFQLWKPPLPEPVVASFQDEGIGGPGGDYGLPGKGSPTEVDHLDFVVDGRQGSIRVANRGIAMFTASTPELVRLHRFFSVLQKHCT